MNVSEMRKIRNHVVVKGLLSRLLIQKKVIRRMHFYYCVLRGRWTDSVTGLKQP